MNLTYQFGRRFNISIYPALVQGVVVYELSETCSLEPFIILGKNKVLEEVDRKIFGVLGPLCGRSKSLLDAPGSWWRMLGEGGGDWWSEEFSICYFLVGGSDEGLSCFFLYSIWFASEVGIGWADVFGSVEVIWRILEFEGLGWMFCSASGVGFCLAVFIWRLFYAQRRVLFSKRGISRRLLSMKLGVGIMEEDVDWDIGIAMTGWIRWGSSVVGLTSGIISSVGSAEEGWPTFVIGIGLNKSGGIG